MKTIIPLIVLCSLIMGCARYEESTRERKYESYDVGRGLPFCNNGLKYASSSTITLTSYMGVKTPVKDDYFKCDDKTLLQRMR